MRSRFSREFTPVIPKISEQPIPPNIKAAYKSLLKKGILGKLIHRLSYSDIPQFYYYACEYPNGKKTKKISYGFGSDDEEGAAVTRAIGEAIEHYCILHEQKDLLIRGTYNKLKPKAIDPLRFVPFSRAQLAQKKYRRFVITRNTELNWLEGYSLTRKKKVLIPASIVYAKYSSRRHKEPIIQIPISTGAACGPTLAFALYSGLCEVIERDAYMISFLPGIKKRLIIVNSDDDLFEFKRRIERYNFEVFLLDTSLDTPTISVVCLIVDRSGSGPAVSAGLGGSLDKRLPIQTAALEAVRRHIANRDNFFRRDPLPFPKRYSFDWFLRRKQQLWSAPHMISQAEKIIKLAEKVEYSDIKDSAQPSNEENVDFLVNKLEKLGCEVLFVNMTVPEVAKVGLHVVKVVCPEMVPLWHDDRYPYLGIKRLYEVPKKYGYKPSMDFTTSDLINMHPF